MTESIGQQLRKRREARRLSLEQAALETRIRLRYLQALEADDFTLMPSIVQVRGFLRSYAQYLELPVDSLLAQLNGGLAASEAASPVEADQPAPEPVSQPVASSASQLIFQEIGDQLRSQREMLSLTLEEVEHNTHLRLRYLKALESGHLEGLPSPVQGRGMLSNYATFLGLDTDALLLRFAEGLQTRLLDRRSASRLKEDRGAAKAMGRPSAMRRRFLAPDFMIGLFTVLALVGFVIWAALRVSQIQSGQEPTFTAPSIADVLAQDIATAMPAEPGAEALATLAAGEEQAEINGESEATATFAIVIEQTTDLNPEIESPTPTFPVAESGVIQLYLIARQRAWVRVVVDGQVELEGRINPGNPYLFTGNERVELLTGNGAALQVFLNRQDLGPLGISGEVIQRVFTLEGMQTPTPAVPPTSRPTETATITLTPEGTPSATPTPLNFAP
jgi:cytoskeleton protein RodZ